MHFDAPHVDQSGDILHLLRLAYKETGIMGREIDSGLTPPLSFCLAFIALNLSSHAADWALRTTFTKPPHCDSQKEICQ